MGESGLGLNRYIKHRKVPLETSEVFARKKSVEQKLKEEYGTDSIDMENVEKCPVKRDILNKLHRMENNAIHKWAPIEFDSTGALVYLLTRTPAEFASLKYIFQLVKEKVPDYQPRTLFDFGSGVGCGLWAFRDTFGEVTEAFCVDPSKEMNDLARLILGEGKEIPDIPTGISFRMHTPSTVNLRYDLVLSSHTLLELPNVEARLQSLHNLWDRVEPGGCLVILETGTNAGFQLVAEARDYLTQLSHLEQDRDNTGGHLQGHALAPCPHDVPCPRFLRDTIPCNFAVRYRYFELDRPEDKPSRPQSDPIFTERISYLVFRKSTRDSVSLPRLVEEPLKTKGNMYCRLCTSQGQLQEVLCRKKDDNDLYQLAKRLRLGDELPVKLEPFQELKAKVGMPWLKREKLVKDLEQ